MKPAKKHHLPIKKLAGWEFTLEISLFGQRVSVTRSVDKKSRVIIQGNTEAWPIQPSVSKGSDQLSLKTSDWLTVLSTALFALPISLEIPKYKPTPRSLLSYFLRTGDDAYLDPFSHASRQNNYDKQINVGFLIGLDWTYARQFQLLKDRKKSIKELRKLAASGALSSALGTVGELEAEYVELQSRAELHAKALDDFKVHPQYNEIQRRCDRLTQRLHDLTNRNLVDQQLINRYKESLTDEGDKLTMSQIETDTIALYEQLNVQFSNAVKKTLEESKRFQAELLTNRISFLNSELLRLERKTRAVNKEIEEITSERANLLSVLRTHGALSEYSKLQELHSQDQAKLENTRLILERLKKSKTEERRLTSELNELLQLVDQDRDNRRSIWSNVVVSVTTFSKALYHVPGHFVIENTESGFDFKIDIKRAGSQGVEKMKIFCFDLALLQQCRLLDRNIDFLVHDSYIWDGVDSRQVAHAIELAAEFTAQTNCQYICTINSDTLKSAEFSEDFTADEYVRLTLKDKPESESLYGFRYER